MIDTSIQGNINVVTKYVKEDRRRKALGTSNYLKSFL